MPKRRLNPKRRTPTPKRCVSVPRRAETPLYTETPFCIEAPSYAEASFTHPPHTGGAGWHQRFRVLGFAFWALISRYGFFLVADDFKLVAGGRAFARSILAFVWRLVVLGVPLGWKKSRGGQTFAWVGHELSFK